MRPTKSPLRSLHKSCWFKLICGASHHHAAHVHNLALIYALAGADCIDIAADPAVVAAARRGIETAVDLSSCLSLDVNSVARTDSSPPWLMVSVNDGEDPHFRKAWFDPQCCPSSCHRPCARTCPVDAISANLQTKEISQAAASMPVDNADQTNGVDQARCYGCGRCLNVCPYGLIEARSHRVSMAAIADYITERTSPIDAIEIHTQVGHLDDFQVLWDQLKPGIPNLKLISISCPSDKNVIEYLRAIENLVSPLSVPLVWQADGRPMSGDIGDGTTHTTIRFAQQIMEADIPGFVQLAGGANNVTVSKAQQQGLLPYTNTNHKSGRYGPYAAGVAYGSYARQMVGPYLDLIDSISSLSLGQNLDPLLKAVEIGSRLVNQLKNPSETTSNCHSIAKGVGSPVG